MNSPTIEFAVAERDKCEAYMDGNGPDFWMALLGWMDWEAERRILANIPPPTTPPDHPAPCGASGDGEALQGDGYKP